MCCGCAPQRIVQFYETVYSSLASRWFNANSPHSRCFLWVKSFGGNSELWPQHIGPSGTRERILQPFPDCASSNCKWVIECQSASSFSVPSISQTATSWILWKVMKITAPVKCHWNQKTRKQTRKTPRACLFCTMRAKTSSNFLVEQQGKQGMIFGVWPTISPRPLLCVYFNYSLHFAWKL